MNFLIVDFDHYEMLYALLKSIQNEAEDIVVCTSQQYIDSLKDTVFHNNVHITWIPANTAEDLYNNRQQLSNKSFHYTFLNTIYSHFDYANQWIGSINVGKIILTIHNVNFWLQMGTRYKIFKRPRSIDHAIMLRILNKASAVMVLSENIKEYLQSKYKIEVPVIVFPYSINEYNYETYTNNHKIKMVIPGIIEQGRKDYMLVLKVFGQLPIDKFSLQLLGRPKGAYGVDVVAKCEELKALGYEISYYTDFVLQNEFEEQISTADIIVAPVILDTFYAGIPEVYGMSKETGAVFDMVRYAKPGIIPAKLKTSKYIREASLVYGSEEELLKCFNTLDNKDELSQLRKKAIDTTSHYHITNVSKALFSDLKSLSA